MFEHYLEDLVGLTFQHVDIYSFAAPVRVPVRALITLNKLRLTHIAVHHGPEYLHSGDGCSRHRLLQRFSRAFPKDQQRCYLGARGSMVYE
jgi:hypothetical protein